VVGPNTSQSIVIEGVALRLAHSVELDVKWVGQEILKRQLLASWLVVDKKDLPLNPRLIGKPGIGKTTLAYGCAKELGREVYLFQCTADTRPEDLIVSPVIDSEGKISYHASSIVTAMVRGGVAILDEGNRMSEKSWASLASLLDQRRYVESIVAGILIRAHPDFRCCVTLNTDASVYEIPEYILTRLSPSIELGFPSREEEYDILQYRVPFAPRKVLDYVVDFLQLSHQQEQPYTVRDGISIARYTMKLAEYANDDSPDDFLEEARDGILGSNPVPDEDNDNDVDIGNIEW